MERKLELKHKIHGRKTFLLAAGIDEYADAEITRLKKRYHFLIAGVNLRGTYAKGLSVEGMKAKLVELRKNPNTNKTEIEKRSAFLKQVEGFYNKGVAKNKRFPMQARH